MSNMTIYEKLNFINNNTNLIKQILVDSGLLTADEATLENLPPTIQELTKQQENPYQKLYMQRTANETNMKGLFAYSPASTTLDLSMMNTSKVTDMSYMFYYCKVPFLDLSGFDISKVTNMEYMFNQCSSEININGWDTSKLTNASDMFSYFTNGGKYLDLSILDFSNVTKADSMFGECDIDYIDIRNLNLNLSKLSTLPFKNVTGTVLDLSNYDITGLTSTYNLCYFCDCKTVDLTNWKTTEVTKMNNTFYYCSSIEKIIMPDWDMTNTTNTSNFFYNCSKLIYIDLSRSNDATIAKIASLVPAKTLATYGQMIIPADSSQANIDALVAKYWKPVGPRIDMTSTELVLELDEIKPGKTTKLYYGNITPWYGNDANVEYISSDESVVTVDKETMMVVSTGVEGTVNITARIADTQEVISEPKVLSISETDNYPNVIKLRFNTLPTGNTIEINNKDIKLTDMDYNSISKIYTYDVGAPINSFDFGSFSSYFTELIKFNTSNLTTMQSMFGGCTNLTSLDVSNFDTSNVTTMSTMFQNCYNLTSLDLSSFDTRNVTTMYRMFYNCYKLTALDLSNFDMTNVTSVNQMFSNCTSLHMLRLDNCNNITINKIITSYNFPTNAIAGVTRKIYCKEESVGDLTPPENWIFEFVD